MDLNLQQLSKLESIAQLFRELFKNVEVRTRDANSGGQGGRPAPLPSRSHSIPMHFPLDLHAI